MNYNDGKWHGWNGGECPVHPETMILGCFEDGVDYSANGSMPAGSYDWECDDDCAIIAFRVTKEHKEPREFWAVQDEDDVWIEVDCTYKHAIKFREVIE